jgi:hypothetical protein
MQPPQLIRRQFSGAAGLVPVFDFQQVIRSATPYKQIRHAIAKGSE